MVLQRMSCAKASTALSPSKLTASGWTKGCFFGRNNIARTRITAKKTASKPKIT